MLIAQNISDYSNIIIYVIIGTVAFIGAYYLYNMNSKYVSIRGTVISIDNLFKTCTQLLDAKGNKRYSCLFTVSYNYNGISSTVQLERTNHYSVYIGQSIDLLYNPTDPTSPPILAQIPWVLILLCIIGFQCYLAAYYDHNLFTTKELQSITAKEGKNAYASILQNMTNNMWRGL